MRLIDSSVLIAFFRKNEELHSRAVELFEGYGDEAIVCTTAVFQEVIERIRRLDGATKGAEVAQAILSSSRFVLEAPDANRLSDAASVMKKFPKLSFCDALTAAIAKHIGVKEIISFDSDFDAFKDFRRLS